MANIQSLQDPHIVALVERGAIDAFYGITPEERNVLNVIRNVNDLHVEE